MLIVFVCSMSIILRRYYTRLARPESILAMSSALAKLAAATKLSSRKEEDNESNDSDIPAQGAIRRKIHAWIIARTVPPSTFPKTTRLRGTGAIKTSCMKPSRRSSMNSTSSI